MSNSIAARTLVLAFVLAAACSAPRTASEPTRYAGVDSAVALERAQTATPGIAVALVSGDRVVYAKGYGSTAAQNGSPVTPNTIFRIASITKVFTAATALGAADSAGMSLNAPIGDRLGALAEPFRSLTLHQLLSNTAGLSIGPVPVTSGDSVGAIASSVTQVPARAAFMPPGEMFSYSNLGYMIAGRTIEVLTGQSYAEAVKGRVLSPLKMTSTRFGVASPSSDVAAGFLELPPGAQPPSIGGAESWPFGGLSSNVMDLSHFAIAFINRGRFDGDQVFTQSTIDRISQHVMPFVEAEGDYGYGVRVYRHRGVDVVEHGGRGLDGYRSLLYMVPSRRVAVIVLASGAGRRAYGIADAALDVLLGTSIEPIAPAPTVVAMEPTEMSKYVGRYASGVVAEVVIDNGKLALRQGTSLMPILKLSNGQFIARDGDAGSYLGFVMRGDRAAYLHVNMRAYRRMD